MMEEKPEARPANIQSVRMHEYFAKNDYDEELDAVEEMKRLLEV